MSCFFFTKIVFKKRHFLTYLPYFRNYSFIEHSLYNKVSTFETKNFDLNLVVTFFFLFYT